MNILVLFDIDDTILRSHNTEGAWDRVSRKMYGVPWKISKRERSGRTEPDCFLENAKKSGISEQEAREKISLVMKELAEEFRKSVKSIAIPGVKELLMKLEKLKIPCGVLTGNSRARAKVKLEKTSLERFFRFGGYGDDSETKEEMMQHALLSAEHALGKKFLHRNVVVIGDTPWDVKAGKHWGARTIAVATGPTDTEELRKTKPDYFFKDMKETDKIIQAIVGFL